MNGVKQRKFRLVLILLALAAAGAVDQRGFAAEVTERCGSDQNAQPDYCQLGGDVPIPFQANQRVELADGESYLLIGRVKIDSRSQAYLEIDFDEHPWLANAKRVQNPLYLLNGPLSYWRQFRNMRVKLFCAARGQVAVSGGSAEYRIHLERDKNHPVAVIGR